jgi:hypothetical protein
MSDLTPAAQTIVALMKREGPMTWDQICRAFSVLIWGHPGAHVPQDDLDSFLSCDLLLEGGRTVECPECKDRAEWCGFDRPGNPKCSNGFVEERVIGVRCGDGCEGSGQEPSTMPNPQGDYFCSRSIPGLDPGTENNPQPLYHTGFDVDALREASPQLAPREEW